MTSYKASGTWRNYSTGFTWGSTSLQPAWAANLIPICLGVGVRVCEGSDGRLFKSSAQKLLGAYATNSFVDTLKVIPSPNQFFPYFLMHPMIQPKPRYWYNLLSHLSFFLLSYSGSNAYFDVGGPKPSTQARPKGRNVICQRVSMRILGASTGTTSFFISLDESLRIFWGFG